MADQGIVKEIVRDVLTQELGSMEVVSINIWPDIDEYGEKIIKINVIFGGREKKLDPTKTAGLARHLIPRLQDVGEGAFPILSFIAKSELGKLNPELV